MKTFSSFCRVLILALVIQTIAPEVQASYHTLVSSHPNVNNATVAFGLTSPIQPDIPIATSSQVRKNILMDGKTISLNITTDSAGNIENFTNNTKISLSDTDGVHADITVGTTIVSKDGRIASGTLANLDITQPSILDLMGGPDTILDAINMGIDGESLQFSKPVAVYIPTTIANGTVVSLGVKHAGDAIFATEGLTDDPNASCTAGRASTEIQTATVSGNAVSFYTCAASTFVFSTVNGGTLGAVGATAFPLCVGCSVTNASNILSTLTTDYASINLPLGLGTNGYITLNLPQLYSTGTRAGFTMDLNGGLASLSNAATVTTYMGGIAQETLSAGSLINLVGLGGGANVAGVFCKSFDAMRITAGSLIGLAATYKVYSNFVESGAYFPVQCGLQSSSPEICSDTIDNDGDDKINMEDEDCTTMPTITTPLSGTSVTTTTTLITGTGLANQSIKILSATGAILSTGTINALGIFSITTPLAVGINILTVSSTSMTGDSIIISRLLPTGNTYTAHFTNPFSGQTFSSSSIILSGSTSLNLATISILIKNTAQTFSTTLTSVATALGGWIATAIGLPDDTYTASIVASDLLGNISSTGYISFGIDTTPPLALGNLSPINLATINPALTMMVGSGEVGATVTIKDALFNVIGTGLVGSGGSFGILLAGLTAMTIMPLSVTQSDTLLNISLPTLRTYILDTTTLTPTIITPIAGSTLATGTVTMIGLAESNASISIAISGGLTYTGTANLLGSFSIPVLLSAPDGVKYATVTATDAVGNTASTTISVTRSIIDIDGDGQLNTIEDAGFNNGDGNGDGLLDSLQVQVANTPNIVTNGTTTLAATGGCSTITNYHIIPESANSIQDPNHTYPVGFNDFTISCLTPGATGSITFYYDRIYDTTQWKREKYDNGVYTDIGLQVHVSMGNALISGINQHVTMVTFIIQDGGIGDQDGIANGIIVDPVGPAVPIPIPSSQVTSHTSSVSTSFVGGGSSKEINQTSQSHETAPLSPRPLPKKSDIGSGCANMMIYSGAYIGNLTGIKRNQALICWAYSQGMTIYKTNDAFGPEIKITRGETAKMIAMYTKNVIHKKTNSKNSISQCTFDDIEIAPVPLQGHIINVCLLRYMQGYVLVQNEQTYIFFGIYEPIQSYQVKNIFARLGLTWDTLLNPQTTLSRITMLDMLYMQAVAIKNK